ncbi:MAG: plastocyanin/azurin family copper-binding protein [Chitinophagaceae bacterium]
MRKELSIKKYWLLLLLVMSNIMLQAQKPVSGRSDTTRIQRENDIYPLRSIPIPQNIPLEVGGMTFLPNDALAVATRHGEVWIISNPYMKGGRAPVYKLFAQGMHEVLGLNFIRGDLYCVQRSELTRLRDLDGDGEADEYKTMYSWPLAGNYHEYAYGPILDKDGNMVVTLNLGWIGFGESLSKWHGWMLKFDKDFNMKPFAAGLRSPAAFALNEAGDIFYAENQGDWVGSGNIAHVEEGDFLGNPRSLRWSGEPGSPVKLKISDIPDTGNPKFDVAKKVPGLKTPSVWFPHTILGISTSGILSYGAKGKMGPFEGQLFVGDQGQSKIMRVALEKIKGVYQGIVFPFREGFSSGILRLNWGSDGSIFAGMTARGWGSTGGQQYGLQQVEWSGTLPFEIKTVTAKPDGFELNFTMPVDESTARNPASYDINSFTYMYHHIYGSPAINQNTRIIKAIEISADKLKVRLVLDSLKEGYVHEIKAEGIRSADNYALMHNYGYYTLNRIPDGDIMAISDANRVATKLAHEHNMAMDMPVKKAEKAAIAAVTVKHLTKQPASWTKGPDRTIVVGTRPGLKFDVESITLKAGTRIKVTFNNNDDMLHNFVITTPGAATEVGLAAIKLGISGERLSYIPATSKVLFNTLLLQPGKSESIYFTAPEKPGNYEFLCSYPGHYMVMRGILKIEK